MWTEVPKGKNKKPVNKDRFISYVALHIYGVGDLIERVSSGVDRKMFLRGDSVILGMPRRSCSRSIALTYLSTVLRNAA